MNRYCGVLPGWRARHVCFMVALLLVALILFSPLGAGPGALDSEKVFMAALNNSLFHLDQAKQQWVEAKHKSEQDIPSMGDLTPYLGNWTNRIAQLITLGIKYKITPISETEPQSDIATLTRELHFRRGICRFYPAGTRYSLQTRWAGPESGSASWFRAYYFNKREMLAAALFLVALGSLLVFVVQLIRNSRQVGPYEHENA